MQLRSGKPDDEGPYLMAAGAGSSRTRALDQRRLERRHEAQQQEQHSRT